MCLDVHQHLSWLGEQNFKKSNPALRRDFFMHLQFHISVQFLVSNISDL